MVPSGRQLVLHFILLITEKENRIINEIFSISTISFERTLNNIKCIVLPFHKVLKTYIRYCIINKKIVYAILC